MPSHYNKEHSNANKLFMAVWDLSMNGLMLSDAQSEIVDVNSAFLGISGYSGIELIDQNISMLFTQSEIDNEKGIYHEITSLEPSGEIIESRIKKKNGDFLPVECKSNLIKGENSKKLILTSIKDITSLKQKEEQIKQHYEQFADIVHSVPGAAYQFLVNKDGKFEFPFLSSSIEELFEVPLDDIESADDLFGLIHPEDLEGVNQSIQKSLRNVIDWSKEFRIITKTGKLIWLQGISKPRLRNDGQMAWNGIFLNIQERKEAEIAKQEKEAMLSHITSNMPGVVYEFTLSEEKYNFLYMSEGSTSLFGISPEEITNNASTLIDKIPPEDRANLKKAIKHSAKNMTPFQLEHQLITKQGKNIWFKVLAKPQQTTNGIIWAGLSFDITEQKKAEKALIDNEIRFRLIATQTNDVIYEWDIEKDEMKWYGSFTKIFEEPRPPKTIQSLLMKIHPEDRLKIENSTRQSLRERSNWKQEYRLVTANNNIKNLLGTGIALYKNNKPYKVYGAITDISEQTMLIEKLKSAKERMERSESLFRTIFENATVGMAQSDKLGNIITVNKEFERIIGYSERELQQINVKDITHPDDHAQEKKFFEQLKSKEIDRIVMEKRYIHKQGHIVWVKLFLAIIIDKQEQIEFVLGVIHDITEQRESKLALIESEKKLQRQINEFQLINEELKESNKRIIEINERLRKVNEELDSFVYRVSHDLRAPISSSLGLTKLTQSADKFEDVQKYAQLQELSLIRLDNFIKDILNYSRNSRISINITEIDFDELLNIVLDENKFNLEKDISINKNLDLGIPFHSDALRVKIILNNLISNAIKFQNPYQENPMINIDIQNSEKEAIIKIEDNGIGIQEPYLNKIFDMFYRATDKVAGSGIGLYIVKDCLSKIEGSIDVKSIFGIGSIFTVKVPNLFK